MPMTNEMMTAMRELDHGISKLMARAAFLKTDAAILGRELSPLERQVIEFMDNMTATYDFSPSEYWQLDKINEVGPEVKKDAIPTGWLCPRCGAVNAPDVKRCECEPSVEDNRRGALGPSEVK